LVLALILINSFIYVFFYSLFIQIYVWGKYWKIFMFMIFLCIHFHFHNKKNCFSSSEEKEKLRIFHLVCSNIVWELNECLFFGNWIEADFYGDFIWMTEWRVLGVEWMWI
jgi:hypothetical protein